MNVFRVSLLRIWLFLGCMTLLSVRAEDFSMEIMVSWDNAPIQYKLALATGTNASPFWDAREDEPMPNVNPPGTIAAAWLEGKTAQGNVIRLKRDVQPSRISVSWTLCAVIPAYGQLHVAWNNPCAANTVISYLLLDTAGEESRDLQTADLVYSNDSETPRHVRLQISCRQSQFLSLQSGWNLIVLTMALSENAAERVLACEPVRFCPVAKSYVKAEALTEGQAYWLFSNTPQMIAIDGMQSNVSIALHKGWNLIGFPVNHEAIPEVAVAWQWIDNHFRLVQTYEAGSGYWIFASQDKVISIEP